MNIADKSILITGANHRGHAAACIVRCGAYPNRLTEIRREASQRAFAPPRSADGAHFPAPAATSEETIAAVGLQSRYTGSGRHLEFFEDLSRSRIDAPNIALVAFPRAVPHLSVDPCYSSDKAVRLDRSKYRARGGIDLMDLSLPIVANPQRPFGPRES